MRHRLAFSLVTLTLWAGQAILARAQEPENLPAPSQVIVDTAPVAEAPAAPAKAGPALDLDACIDMGFQHQPALDAARASLAATQAGKQGIDRLRFAGLLARDIPIRRQQACQGLTIAEAALVQAEWNTRYAITRNFFTVQYVREQQKVIEDVLRSLENGRARAQKIFDAGDVVKITQIDIDAITIQIAIVTAKKATADNGLLKAMAALREGMGLKPDCPLEIAEVALPPATYRVLTPDPKDGKKEIATFHPLFKFDRDQLIASAVVNRGEVAQANAANRITHLEIQAQLRKWGIRTQTFAAASDIHAQPIPPSLANSHYSPGGLYPDYPTMFVGHRRDREQRAIALDQRMGAVRDKAENLVSLDVEAQYLNWQEAVEEIQQLQAIYDIAHSLPDKVLKTIQGKDLTGGNIIAANMTAIQVRTHLNEELHAHALALAGLERATAGAFRVFPIPGAPAALPK